MRIRNIPLDLPQERTFYNLEGEPRGICVALSFSHAARKKAGSTDAIRDLILKHGENSIMSGNGNEPYILTRDETTGWRHSLCFSFHIKASETQYEDLTAIIAALAADLEREPNVAKDIKKLQGFENMFKPDVFAAF